MKLSKKTWLILAAIVFIVALVGVGRAYLQQASAQKQVNEQLASAQARLTGIQLGELPSKQAELEKQLSQATAQSEAGNITISQPVGDVAISSVLFDLAKSYSVEVTGVTFSGTANTTLEGVTWSVTSLTVKFEGESPNLLGLATKLNSRFTTGVIKSAAITIPETNSGDNASAEIQMAVYTYQGG